MRLTWTGVYPVRHATSTPESSSAISKTALARRFRPAGEPAALRNRSSSARSSALSSIGRTRLAMTPPKSTWLLY
jgi:hypothetical protein